MAVTSSTREGRAVVAAMGQLWAFFSLQHYGSTAMASSVLTLFQRDWVNTRATIMGSLSASTRAAFDPVFPRSLVVDGRWGVNSAKAAKLTIFAVFGNAVYTEVSEVPMPDNAAGIGLWWFNNLDTYAEDLAVETRDALYAFEDAAAESSPSEVQPALVALTQQTIDGVAPAPRIANPAASVVADTSTANAVADVLNASAAATDTSIETASADPGIVLEETRLIGRRRTPKTSSGWLFAAVAVGALTFGGLAIFMWDRRRRAQ